MSATTEPSLTREQLRADFEMRARLDYVLAAISDMSSAEFKPSEAAHIGIKDGDGMLVTAVRHIPHEVVLVGLRAMQRELEAQLRNAEITQ